MPRLLPRLLKWLEQNPPSQPNYRGPLVELRPRRRRSLWKPTRAPDEYAEQFSLKNRLQSLVLDHESIVVLPNRRVRHKTLPPVVKIDKNQAGRVVDQDSPREMTDQERQWWSSPYLRMLSSPLRLCLLSERHLPSDFLIRIVALQTRGDHPEALVVPSGILHPRFATRFYGAVRYVTCSKEALENTIRSKKFERVMKSDPHSLLSEQISHQLRQRVLQELEMLVLRLKAAPRASGDEIIIRRLTRSEWKTMKDTGQVPWERATCILIVPPVNRNPHTKQRPQPDYSDCPPDVSEADPAPKDKALPPLPPICTVRPTREPDYEEPLRFLQDTHLPHSRVPVYNGLSLFPSRSQRAALHQKLCGALAVERRIRLRQKQLPGTASSDEKPSHAFIVFSNARTVVRADTVPLAIALWRIKMWEGEGWGDCEWLLRQSSQGPQ